MMEDAMTNDTDPTTVAAARAVRTQLILVLAELRLGEDGDDESLFHLKTFWTRPFENAGSRKSQANSRR
jgi:hypothetical protein